MPGRVRDPATNTVVWRVATANDADIDAATAAAIFGRMQNAGQACTASKRFIVLDEVYDEFVDAFTRAVADLTVGDPSDDVAVGPLSSEAAAVTVADQIQDAITSGATVLTGGKRVDREGAFVEPTVLTDVTPAARAYREEIFGPVATVYRVHSVDEAITLANDSHYGLGSVIFGTIPRSSTLSPNGSTSGWSRSTAPHRRSRTCPSVASRRLASAENSATTA